MVVGEKSCEVSDEDRERAPGVSPCLEVRAGGRAGEIDERVVPANWVAVVWGDDDEWRHERVVFVDPDCDRNERCVSRDMEFSGDA